MILWLAINHRKKHFTKKENACNLSCLNVDKFRYFWRLFDEKVSMCGLWLDL